MRSRSSSRVIWTPSFESAARAGHKNPAATRMKTTDDLVRLFRVIALNATDPNEGGSIQNLVSRMWDVGGSRFLRTVANSCGAAVKGSPRRQPWVAVLTIGAAKRRKIILVGRN